MFAPIAGAPAASALPTLAIAPGVVASGSLTSMYRSNNKSVSLSGTATVATEHFSIGYDGSWSHGSDYHAGGGAVAPSTSYAAEDHALTLAYKNDDQLITLRGAIEHDPFEGFPNEYMDMLDNQASSVNLSYKGGFGWGQLDADAFYQHTQHYMNFGTDKSKGTVYTTTTGMPMWTDGQDFGYSLKTTIAASKIDTIRIGNEFHGETLNDWWTPSGTKVGMMCCGTFENINDGTRDRFGAYSEWERQWAPQWTTLIGVRGEIVDTNAGDVQGYSSTYLGTATYPSGSAAFNALSHAKTFDDLDWTALTRYTPNADATYEAGVTQKTRAPSLYELYAWSTNSMAAMMNGWAGDGDGYVGNL